MKLLLDTHIFLWWCMAPDKLSHKAYAAIQDQKNEVFISAATSWEIGIKFQLKHLSLPDNPYDFMIDKLRENLFLSLQMTHEDCCVAASLPLFHKDPFDRMLVAQSKNARLTLVSIDEQIQKYEVELLR